MDGSQEPKRRNPGSGQAEKARFWCFFLVKRLKKVLLLGTGCQLGAGEVGLRGDVLRVPL